MLDSDRTTAMSVRCNESLRAIRYATVWRVYLHRIVCTVIAPARELALAGGLRVQLSERPRGPSGSETGRRTASHRCPAPRGARWPNYAPPRGRRAGHHVFATNRRDPLSFSAHGGTPELPLHTGESPTKAPGLAARRTFCQRKVMISRRAVIPAGVHAALLENASRSRKGRGRFCRVSRAAPFRRGQCERRAGRASRSDSLCGVCCSLQKQRSSFFSLRMMSSCSSRAAKNLMLPPSLQSLMRPFPLHSPSAVLHRSSL